VTISLGYAGGDHLLRILNVSKLIFSSRDHYVRIEKEKQKTKVNKLNEKYF